MDKWRAFQMGEDPIPPSRKMQTPCHNNFKSEIKFRASS